MNTTPTPRTLELCSGGSAFYLRDERGDYIAKTCGDCEKDMANAYAIAHRYNAHDQLRALEAETQELAEALKEVLRYADDTEGTKIDMVWKIRNLCGPLLARHRAKQ